MTEEIKKEIPSGTKPEGENGKKPPEPVTDFKICEIWIKSGQLFLEAPQEFWRDKIRAVGILDYCKDLIKEAKVDFDKPRILPAKGSFLNGVRNLVRRK